MGYSLWGHKESDTNEHISPIGYKGAGQARQVVKKTAKRKDYTETDLMSPGHSHDPLFGGVWGDARITSWTLDLRKRNMALGLAGTGSDKGGRLCALRLYESDNLYHPPFDFGCGVDQAREHCSSLILL